MPKVVDREEIREYIPDYLHLLNNREKQIVRMFYGLDGEQKSTYIEIGKTLKLTPRRVQQIEYDAIRRIQFQHWEDQKEQDKIHREVRKAEKKKIEEQPKVIDNIVVIYKKREIMLVMTNGLVVTYKATPFLLDRIHIDRKGGAQWIGGHHM